MQRMKANKQAKDPLSEYSLHNSEHLSKMLGLTQEPKKQELSESE